MRVEVRLLPPPSEDQFAGVDLVTADDEHLCSVQLDFPMLRKLGAIPSEEVLDLLLVSQIVYALDRRVLRESAGDNWSRRFSVAVPVAEPSKWEGVKATLEGCLTFLTNDSWEFAFAAQEGRLVALTSGERLGEMFPPRGASLFSGGLDSLIGVIDYLESSPDEGILLVGHHDPRMAGPLSDQKGVCAVLERYYAGRTHPVFVAAGPDSGHDTTLRSRSFSFIALGLYVANTLREHAPLLIPENGNISLNIPLTPSRAGSLSTRTTHPYYLARLRDVLRGLGIANPLVNSLEIKTKGECVAKCLNREVLKSAAPVSASCAKRGHRSTWRRRTTRQCGRCMPCVYRRAALHAIGLDSETYGRDICTGEVPIDSNYGYADDFRACVSFLRQGYSREEIAALLLENGRLDVSRLPEYARIVDHAMDEIRDLLRDKATNLVKRRAGLLPA